MLHSSQIKSGSKNGKTSWRQHVECQQCWTRIVSSRHLGTGQQKHQVLPAESLPITHSLSLNHC